MGMLGRRFYSTHDKLNALTSCQDIGVIKTSSEFGIPKGTLRKWVNQANNGILGKQHTDDEDKEDD
jgi:transposase-like protein